MLKTPFKALLVGGQIAAASLMATTAIAQTTVIETPESTVIVPDDALEEYKELRVRRGVARRLEQWVEHIFSKRVSHWTTRINGDGLFKISWKLVMLPLSL